MELDHEMQAERSDFLRNPLGDGPGEIPARQVGMDGRILMPAEGTERVLIAARGQFQIYLSQTIETHSNRPANSSGVLAFFRTLQVGQASTRFSGPLLPPLTNGHT